MSEYKALENIPDDIQEIIKNATTRCIRAIEARVPNTGVAGEGNRPKKIIEIMRRHGEGQFARSTVNLFDGMGRALDLIEILQNKDEILVEDIQNLREAQEILKTILADKTHKKKAGGTNPRNIRFRVVTKFKLEDGKPVVVDRGDVFGHYKTPTVIRYLDARKEYARQQGEEYTGPNYKESSEDVRFWASDKPNTSKPPLFVALQTFEAELRKILKEIKTPPEPADPIVINIDKGVKLEPFSKLASLKEGFREIVSNPEIYPKIPTRRDGKKVLGSNKPIIVGYDKSQRTGQKTFTSEVTEYIFRITSNADRKILDEAVPGWGEEGKDLAQTSSLEEFRLKVNSTRRTKTLVRLTLGGELSTIRIPDRTPGVVLKAQEFLEEINKSRYGEKSRQSKKLEIIDKILTNSSEPLTVREILERWRDLTNYAGRPYKNIPTTNELSMILKRHGYKIVNTVRKISYWGPREE